MITIGSYPTNISAAWRPILWQVTSSRYASTVKSVTAVSSGTGGFARYAIATNTYEVGDVVTGSAFTGLSVAYNIVQTVTVSTGSYVETNVLFVATATGPGTMKRTNENFQMKCQTYVFEEAKITFTTSLGAVNPNEIQLDYATPHGYVTGEVVSVEDNIYMNRPVLITAHTSTRITFIGSLAELPTGYAGKTRRGRLIGTTRLPAIIVSSNYVFQNNPAGHLQASLSPELLPGVPSNIQTPSTKALKVYTVLFTEEYDDRDGFITQGNYILGPVTTRAIRAVWQHYDSNQNMGAYLVGGLGTAAKFLTNAPRRKKIRVGEEEQLSFITELNETLKVAIIKYNLGGVAAGVIYLSGVLIVDNRGIISINASIFNNTNSRVDVWLVNTSNVARSETFTFIMDYSNYQNAVRMHFENTLGGVDAYTFTGAFKKDITSKRTSFKKLLTNGFLRSDRGTKSLGNRIGLANEVYSEFLSNAEATWLQDLLYSADVYTKSISESEFTAINIYTESLNVYDSENLTQMRIVYAEANPPLGLNN